MPNALSCSTTLRRSFFGQSCALFVLGYLLQDALDLCGVIGGFITDDLNGNSWKISFNGRRGSTVSEEHTHVA
jgi:hypothetical protein